jgi:hypothetical protein
MNPFEFVIAVLFLVFAFAIIRHKLGMSSGSANVTGGPAQEAENFRLRSQVQHLQDRIKILERIVTDGGVQTAAQIEALREREKIAEDESNG